MTSVLDTDVLSELLRFEPDAAVLHWFGSQSADSLCASSVTQAEMLLGARLLPAGKRRLQLQSLLDAMFAVEFEARILPFDSAAAIAYTEVVAARRSAGQPIAQFDTKMRRSRRSRCATVRRSPPATPPTSRVAASLS